MSFPAKKKTRLPFGTGKNKALIHFDLMNCDICEGYYVKSFEVLVMF